MNKIYKFLSVGVIALLGITACTEKVDDLPYYSSGSASDLSASATTVTATAANANQGVVTFNWTDPGFATDPSNYKYVLEVAPKGTNFAKPVAYTVMQEKTLSLTGSQFNNMLVGWGINFNTPTDLDVRLKSSYGNNNDLKISNLLGIKATSYSVPVTLAATSTGPFAPTPLNKDNILAKLSWNGVVYGSSTASYAIEYAKGGTNFANPTTIAIAKDSLTKSLTGMELYQMANNSGIAFNTTGNVDVRVKVTVDGTNQVYYSTVQTMQVKPVEMILYMYLPGDYQSFDPYKASLPSGNTWGWDPATAPKLASTDGVNYEGYVWVPAGGSGEFKMTSAPNWDNTNYGGTATTLSTSGGNLVWPATGKYYLVKANLTTLTWSTTEITTWGVIGSGTPGGWDGSTPLTFNTTTLKWTGTINFSAGEFKFRANNGWDINLGGTPSSLTYGGANIGVAAGSKTVSLDLNNPLKYTYTIQ